MIIDSFSAIPLPALIDKLGILLSYGGRYHTYMLVIRAR